jgi:hypothetical protein
MPKARDMDDDVEYFRILELTDHLSAYSPLPEKRYPVLDVENMVVSGALMRKIQYELSHGEYDLRTVFNACRGLEKGSREFEEAYIAARIRSSAKHQRNYRDPHLESQLTLDVLSKTHLRPSTTHNLPPPPHPMAVVHLGHLMSHLGIWVMALLGIQVWAAWSMGGFVNVYLEGGRMFHFLLALLLMLALDSAVWFRKRGNLYNVFLIPGTVLFLIALLPILALHLKEVL